MVELSEIMPKAGSLDGPQPRLRDPVNNQSHNLPVPEHLPHKNSLEEYAQCSGMPINEGKAAVQEKAKSQEEPQSSVPDPVNKPSNNLLLPEHLCQKNRLQQFTQRSGMGLPVYQTVNEGAPHAPMFRSTVLVDGSYYTTPDVFQNRKAAEQAVARVAFNGVAQKLKDEGYSLIRKDAIFCKTILNEYAVRMNLDKPTYTTVQSEGMLPVFVSNAVFNGNTYTGDAGKNKREAEQLAARVVLLYIIGNYESATALFQIIRCKFRLYAAVHNVTDSNNTQNEVMPAAVNTGTSFGFPLSKGKEVEVTGCTSNVPGTALHNVTDSNNTRNAIMPAAVNTGTSFGFPRSKGKEVEVTGCTSNVPSTALHNVTDSNNTKNAIMPAADTGTSFGFPLSKGKEVEVTGCTSNVPSIAIPETFSGQLSKSPATHQPFHEFKKPKLGPSTEAIAPPIVFVPPVLEQPLGVGPSSARNRKRKNKKKAKKKSQDAQTRAAVVML